MLCAPLLAISLLLVVKGSDAEPSPAQAIGQIQSALQAELTLLRPRHDDPAAMERYRSLQSALSSVSYIVANPDNPEAERSVAQIAATAQSPKIQELCNNTVKLLRQRRNVADVKALAEVEQALKQATDTVVRAKKPEELDAVLNNLRRLEGRTSFRSSDSSDLNEARRRLGGAISTVRHWQDALLAEQSGDGSGAHNAYRSVSDSSEPGLDIPRSLVITREEAAAATRKKQSAPADTAERTPKADDIVAKIKTLDDIPAALEKIDALPSSQRNQSASLRRSLDELQRNRAVLRDGAPVSLSIPRNSPEQPAGLFDLQMQLLRLALPRFLGLPDDQKPGSAENLDAFLDRTIKAACKAGDWRLAARCMSLRNSVTTSLSGVPSGSPDARAIESYLAGCSQQEARQFRLAVVSFQTALKSGSEFLPNKEIGDRLDAIKAASAKDYEDGVTLFLSPPASNYPDYMAARMRGFPAGFNPQGFPGNPADPRSAPNQPGKIDVPASKLSLSLSPNLTPGATPFPTASPAMSATNANGAPAK